MIIKCFIAKQHSFTICWTIKLLILYLTCFQAIYIKILKHFYSDVAGFIQFFIVSWMKSLKQWKHESFVFIKTLISGFCWTFMLSNWKFHFGLFQKTLNILLRTDQHHGFIVCRNTKLLTLYLPCFQANRVYKH